MEKLGKIEQVYDLRSVWKHESRDFSAWLVQPNNLALLSESIGIDLTLIERESPVGNFSVDVLASEENTGRKIVIENQLEETNHDHLGKIITYAAGKDAQVIIWIVKKARDEHRQAIEWLNAHTDINIGVFLIEIELWKIGDSLPAPVFKVIEAPNDWAKAVRSNKRLSNAEKIMLEFWNTFCEKANSATEFRTQFSRRKPKERRYLDITYNCSFHEICVIFDPIKKFIASEIFFYKKGRFAYDSILSIKDKIDEELGEEYRWARNERNAIIRLEKEVDCTDKTRWPEYCDWLLPESVKLR